MPEIYLYHRVETAPRQWQAVADELSGAGSVRLQAAGGTLYGVWRSQIGRPRDELTAITVWPDEAAARAQAAVLTAGNDAVRAAESRPMIPTLRPADSAPPQRQGNYAFREFVTPEPHWPEFLDLCAAGWPGFEAAYDSQVVGLWRFLDGTDDRVGSLLLTRRPDLSMWERSKIPQGEAEAAVRDKLSRRYDLCDWTCVHTTTLLTAADRQDTARWT